MIQNNPFITSGYVSPEYFCDRETETDLIIDALSNGRNLTLLSPRRMGKTGLIMHAFHQIHETQPDVITLYMDIFPTQNLSDFVHLFAGTVLGKLDSGAKKALSRISKFIKSCRPVFTFDELTGLPKVTLEIDTGKEQNTLEEIFEYLKSSEKKCVIAIDEFQQITEYPEKGIEALLRSHIQFTPNVSFIFAGSKNHIMQQMFFSAKRPFYQSTQLINLENIAEETYYAFASGFFKAQGKTLTEEIFNDIYERYNGHTWYMQAVLNRLYATNAEKITDKTVNAARKAIIADNEYAYESLVSAYPTGSIRLLKAIAKEGCAEQVMSGQFISKYRLKAASSVRSSLKKLTDNELIYKTDKGYIVGDRFLGEWLKNQLF